MTNSRCVDGFDIEQHPAGGRALKQSERRVRQLGAGLFVGLSIFAIYASTLPFNFERGAFTPDWDHIAGRLLSGSQDLGRIDFTTNLVVYVAIGLGGAAWCNVSPRRPVRGLVWGLAVLAGCLLLSLFSEVAQVWLPDRTPSLYDVLAQSLGTAIGIGLWWWHGGHLREIAARLIERNRSVARFDFVLQAYFFLLLFLNLYPFDFIISPDELFRKYRLGQIELRPLAGLGGDGGSILENLIQALFYVPVGALTSRMGVAEDRLRSVAGSIALGGAIAAGMEAMQVLVNSRFTMLSHVLLGTCGAGVGAVLTHLFFPHAGAGRIRWAGRSEWGTWLLLAVVSFAVPFVYLLWPLDFTRDTQWVKFRLHALDEAVPFIAIYETSPKHASMFVERVLLFVPLGACIARVQMLISGRLQRAGIAISIAVVMTAAAVIEGLQLLVPERFPDLLDFVLLAAGGSVGVLMVGWLCPHGGWRPARE